MKSLCNKAVEGWSLKPKDKDPLVDEGYINKK